MPSPRLFVVADVGGPDDFHLGDEAMLEANLETLRRLVPSISFTVSSRDPVWTSRRYAVDAIRGLTFPPELMADPDRFVSEPTADGDDVFRGLGDCDGLVVSGGGNLCATWPEKILERVALIEHARHLRLPVVILGQTLGPALTSGQRRLLSGALTYAEWLGVRDPSSAALAATLGVPAERVHLQLDDAFFLPPQAPDDAGMTPFEARRPWIVVTLDASFGSPESRYALTSIASQLDALADRLRATLVFSPHVGGARIPMGHADTTIGQALAGVVRSPLQVLDLWPARAVRWLIERAALVVSSRYHPLVFATAAGVPALGIHRDAYTRTKLQGALAPAGLTGWCLSSREAERGDLLPLAAEFWHRRGSVHRRLRRFRADAWSDEVRRWEGIGAVLHLTPSSPLALTAPPAPVPCPEIDDAAAQEETDAPRLLTEAQWRQYDEQGYLRLGRVLDDAQLRALGERLNAVMLGHIRHPSLQLQLDTGGAYEELAEPVAGLTESTLAYRKVQGLEVDPLVLDLLRRDLFREICARHYGRHANVSIFRAMMMNKPAGQGTYLPWHQDGGDVWKLDRDPLVTIWVAIDPATRANGCVEVVPGSHRLGLLSTYGSTISPADAERHCPDDAIVHLEVEAGHALLLHNWLIHRSGLNPTTQPRRAFTACYMDGRTLSTLTGSRFPIVFGEHEDADSALPFVQALTTENHRLQAMRTEAERYAKSLEAARAEAERYAQSLEAAHAEAERSAGVRPAEYPAARVRSSVSRVGRWWRSHT